ncbi:PTS system trehalose-specific EIIBC component [Jeotgalibacillus haloalkalitolerans]|uniref:PTS system trehalose-specific EIIBC component n=1 Tax=Jeotgalibacillus haloalkalitolerans TaxID=3104292 RepID=A0ABU5KJM8_9BACL|nr:PTS system trehalose-specific EIIBC component [Jeotgalibacillus sp. HH7-29]MDZ5711459.1 PTS system trehalose-specific EIIBC component [Jeotgalibacillus sp. HH7-29]
MSDVNREQVRQIVEAIGGQENIDTATHCVTRLRFVLHDDSKVDKKKLESIDLVKGSFANSGQYQVVIGQGLVDKVYKVLAEETGIQEVSKDDVKNAATKKMNPLQRAIKLLADIFIPILPAIVTAGLLLGLNNVLTAPDLFGADPLIVTYPQWADIAEVINIIASAAFTFLPALIGWSAVKRFGANPLMGIVLGLVLVHPNLLSAYAYPDALQEGTVPTWNLFGLTVESIGYQGQVLPVLVAAYLYAVIEKFLNRRVHDSIKLLVVAPVSILITGFAAFIVIGPLTFAAGTAVTDAVVWMFENFGWLGGLIYGGFYAVLVITGMHHTFLPVDLQLISDQGGTFLWPILALSNIAQGSAAFAIFAATFFMKNKDEKLKGLASSSGISAWLGVTEPALFGVNLRYKFPFICALIGSGIAGLILGANFVLANSIGVGGVPGIISIQSQFWGLFALGMGIVIVVPFALTLAYALIIKKGKLEEE